MKENKRFKFIAEMQRGLLVVIGRRRHHTHSSNHVFSIQFHQALTDWEIKSLGECVAQWTDENYGKRLYDQDCARSQ